MMLRYDLLKMWETSRLLSGHCMLEL